MVNSALSRIIYIGAYLLAGIALVGFIVLGMAGKPVGPELYGAFFAAMGIIGGAHLKPPISTKATVQMLQEHERDGTTRP